MVSARRLGLVSALGTLIVSSATGVTSNSDLWSKFESLRQSPSTLHQEFEVTRHVDTAYRGQATNYHIAVDIAQGLWREQAIGGGGDLTRLYDGHDLLTFESEGAEYTRTKRKEIATRRFRNLMEPNSIGANRRNSSDSLVVFQLKSTPV